MMLYYLICSLAVMACTAYALVTIAYWLADRSARRWRERRSGVVSRSDAP